jgi:antitoxin PrlF
MVRARLRIKSLRLPKRLREMLDLQPGDELAFVIGDDAVRLVRVPASRDDPFACFTEWASEADRKGYADL